VDLSIQNRLYDSMNRIGILGLDSSHPEAFATILDSMDSMTISAVWDDGDVRSADYARSFADRYNATVYDEPTNLVDAVDGVLVLTVNWDSHASLAAPFLRAGIPTLIDKPIAGRLEDVETLETLARDAPLFGGSAISYHPSLDHFPSQQPGRMLCGAGYNHPFYYGVHLTDTVRRLAGADWQSVTPTIHRGQTVNVVFENNTYATLRFDGPAEHGAFGLLDICERTRTALIDSSPEEHQKMYSAYLTAFRDAITGNRDENESLLDAASLLLAVHAALEANESITPTSQTLRDAHVEGNTFLETYQPHEQSAPTESTG
jgi:hypothetical protein